jgi:Tfp pilus assembly protein PilN
VNLLPREERRSEIPYGRVSVFFTAVFLVLLLLIYGVVGLWTWRVEKQLTAAQTRWVQLLPVRKAMEKAGDKQKRIDAKKALVARLSAQHNTPYNLIPRIAALLPASVWLDESKTAQQDINKIVVKGGAASYSDLAAFISRLEGAGLFRSVTLKSTKGDLQGTVVKQGTLKYTLDLTLKGL